jgi:hypothetical protein
MATQNGDSTTIRSLRESSVPRKSYGMIKRDLSGNTATMKTRIAVRDTSPHRFYVLPLKDAPKPTDGSYPSKLPSNNSMQAQKQPRRVSGLLFRYFHQKLYRTGDF